MIKVNNVTKIFSNNPNDKVLDGISFSISENDFVTLIGPSGCGKTTLLNMMAGYDIPTEGEILMHDEVITTPNHTRAVLSQENALFPWFNVTENIGYGLKARGIDKTLITERTETILKEIGLVEYAKHKTFEISGGMKQRVALAQTLINDPSVILLDEPFAALDTLTRSKMQRLLHNLWQEKHLTLFMITHDIEEALLLSNRIHVMTKGPGKIIKTFTPDFYKSEQYESIHLDPSFIRMKDEILALI